MHAHAVKHNHTDDQAARPRQSMLQFKDRRAENQTLERLQGWADAGGGVSQLRALHAVATAGPQAATAAWLTSAASAPAVQMRKEGKNAQAAEENNKKNTKFSIAVTAEDTQLATTQIAQKKQAIQASVQATDASKPQGHDGNMADLKVRWHNDQVAFLRTGEVEILHASFTKKAEDAAIVRAAAEISKQRVKAEQKRNMEIERIVAQLAR